MYKRYFLFLLIVFLVLPLTQAQKNKLRKRIVVFEFQDKSSSKYQWWDSKTVGEGISELVITSDGGKVYINAGALDGPEKGMTFKVYRLGKALVDPDTRIPPGKIDEEIGESEAADPNIGQGKASLCTIHSGYGFERGDVIRLE